jgi:hypothetical protein
MFLDQQLRNIQSMIRLTKGNLEALNARFAQYQHPPSMYIAEYEDLTSKLNEFQRQEEKLLELIADYGDYEDSPIDIIDGHNYELLANASSGSGSSSSQPRTPLKPVIRAHLPNQQRTTVPVYPGQTVREALAKAMRRRRLTPEMCSVFIYHNKYVSVVCRIVDSLCIVLQTTHRMGQRYNTTGGTGDLSGDSRTVPNPDEYFTQLCTTCLSYGLQFVVSLIE